jgi:ribosomal protein S18 acetylase RimI-like enzyme
MSESLTEAREMRLVSLLEPEGQRWAEQHWDDLNAWIHAAGNPFADWYFGDPETAADIIREWMKRPSSELYARRAALLFDEQEQPAGCILGLLGRDVAACRSADFAAFCRDLGSSPEADEVIERIIAASHELFPQVAADQYYISRVAIDPTRRGQGLGRHMVRLAIQEARARGLSGIRLDVSADSTAAIRAYRAAGLRIASTSHSEISGLTYTAMVL